jgi:hypothetical protein
MIAIVTLVIAYPVWRVVDMAPNSIFAGHFGVFVELMNSSETLTFPLIAVLTTCLGMYRVVVARHIANTRTRSGIRAYLARRLAFAAGGAALLFFAQTAVAFLVAYRVWADLGDPSLDSTTSGAAADAASYSAFAFGSFLKQGRLAFGIGYSTWVALAAATYAALAICLLVTLSNRILALASPLLVYIASDLVFGLSGRPQLSLRFSSFPLGLSGSDPLLAAAPNLVLLAGVSGFVALVLLRAPTNPRLQ